jgi:hypothetical protein
MEICKNLKPQDRVDLRVSANEMESIIWAVARVAAEMKGAGQEYFYDIAHDLEDALKELDEKAKP